MLHAMMEFTVSLLVKRPSAKRQPVPAAELRRRLLALNKPDQPHPLVEGQDCDLEIKWSHEDARRSRFAMSRQASATHLRFLVDEQRHELRMHQMDSGSNFFVGLEGRLPRLQGSAGFGAGPPGEFLTKEIGQVAQRAGWSARPVLWWFQATHSGFRFLQAITPAPLQRWPARRFWGLLYPLSFFLGIAYLAAISWPPDWHDWWLIAGISAAWWSVWGFLVWMLCGFPAFWRR
ncbi:MAG TPA: hypothetical protein VEC96_11040 [Anaerolineae bacterium]|nr:hypothetical protein [Anaerolineae bacterium]